MLSSTFQPAAMPSMATIGPTLPGTQGGAAAAAAVSATTNAAKERTILRRAAGKVWADPSLDDWPKDDFRLFAGDLGNEVTDDLLANAFRKYSSFQKAKVIRDKRTGKTKGYGFVSFSAPEDMVAALRDVNGRYVGNRPVRLKKSSYKDRFVDTEKSRNSVTLKYCVPQDTRKQQKFKKLKVKQDPEKQKQRVKRPGEEFDGRKKR